MPGVLYYNGDILTMEPQLYTPAILVESGRIRAVGSKQQLEAAFGPGVEAFDLQGRTLMPAFIDPHSHITAYASTLALADLSQAKSFAEMKEILLGFMNRRDLPKGAWLIGFGYDHNRLAEHRHPDKALLNTVSAEIPVMITHKSGHMGAVNQRALEKAGIRADTPDPEGGHIGRVEGSREPSGYLEEKAFMALAALVPAPGLEEQKALLQQAEREYLKYGVTTVQDGLLQEQGFNLMRDTPLHVDAVGFADLKQSPTLLKEHPPVRPPGGEQCGTRSGREQDAEAAGVSVRIGIVVQEQQDEQELRVEFTGLGVACPGVALSCRKAALPAIQCRCKHKRQCGKGEVYGNPHHR